MVSIQILRSAIVWYGPGRSFVATMIGIDLSWVQTHASRQHWEVPHYLAELIAKKTWRDDEDILIQWVEELGRRIK